MQITSNQSPKASDGNVVPSSDLIKVSICAATYKRAEPLRDLLESLNNLTFTRISVPTIEVIIVDNDSAASAKTIVDIFRPSFRWPLRYVVETNQGVTFARNRCIAEVAKDSDFIAMLDDDEIAAPQWLEELLINQKRFVSKIVTGPVLAIYKEEQQVPDWIRAGNFYSSHRYETGHEMEVAFTNNVMFSTQLLQTLKEGEPLFDHRFAEKGAEDVYLFTRLHKAGYKIVWADNAVLHEPVVDERMSLKWILNRGFWGWSCHSLIETELNPSIKIQSIRAIKGLALIFIGAVSIGPSMLLGKHKAAKALLNIFKGMGTLSGLMGHQGNWR
ncbi:MAG: glycosyltransferase [Cyanobacteria bacterium P01_B01_bin.77]